LRFTKSPWPTRSRTLWSLLRGQFLSHVQIPRLYWQPRKARPTGQRRRAPPAHGPVDRRRPRRQPQRDRIKH
jgi:hypothetical protein